MAGQVLLDCAGSERNGSLYDLAEFMICSAETVSDHATFVCRLFRIRGIVEALGGFGNGLCCGLQLAPSLGHRSCSQGRAGFQNGGKCLVSDVGPRYCVPPRPGTWKARLFYHNFASGDAADVVTPLSMLHQHFHKKLFKACTSLYKLVQACTSHNSPQVTSQQAKSKF